MIYNRQTTGAMIVAGLLTLAGCESEPKMGQPSDTPSSMETTDYLNADKTMFNIDPTARILNDETLARSALNQMRGRAFSPTPGPQKFVELVELVKLENLQRGLRSMSGLGGVGGRAFIAAAGRKANASGNFNSGSNVDVRMVGQITGFHFEQDPHDSMKGSGWMNVTTQVSTVVDGVAGTPITWEWELEIKNKGFHKIPKNTGHPNYFGPPNKIVFTPAMKNEVDARGFTWKLWAENGKIRIKSLKKDGVPVNPGDPDGHLLISQPSDCIDLMSQNEPMTGGISQFGAYCLGRCERPAIVNTGL